jgi:hypothetical protein
LELAVGAGPLLVLQLLPLAVPLQTAATGARFSTAPCCQLKGRPTGSGVSKEMTLWILFPSNLPRICVKFSLDNCSRSQNALS